MSIKPYQQVSTRQTPQSAPILGRETEMAENYAGGYAFTLDRWSYLDRFLVLGTSEPTYYAEASTLTKEAAQAVLDCLEADYRRTVDRIVGIRMTGRAPRADPAIFALAMAAGTGTPAQRGYALSKLPDVCAIGTDLLHFAGFVEQFRGWGRGLRRAVARWFTDKPADRAAYQMVKYRQRDGWSMRDLLRLCHAKGVSAEDQALFEWVAAKAKGGEAWEKWQASQQPRTDAQANCLPRLVTGFEAVQAAQTKAEVIRLIEEYGLTHEMLPTEWKREPEVWAALLPKMPATALVRNLGPMTRCGLIAPASDGMREAVAKLSDHDWLRKARLHPFRALAALMAYRSEVVLRRRKLSVPGYGMWEEKDKDWTPVRQIVDALDDVFYATFQHVEPTGKRFLLALDVSGSMASPDLLGVPGLTPRVASAVMAMVTARTEADYEVVGFTSSGRGGWYGTQRSAPNFWPSGTGSRDGLTVLSISPRQRLDDIVRAVSDLPFGGTDCSLPPRWAAEKGLAFDAIVFYTDNESWAGPEHTSQAMTSYREQTGLPTKLVAVGMTATEFSIVDPKDPSGLCVVGLDAATPSLISDFVGDRLGAGARDE